MAMIDTLGYVKRLEAAGFSRIQAEAQAEAFRDDIATQVATKVDMEALGERLEHKMDTGITRIEHKVNNLEARFEGKFTL